MKSLPRRQKNITLKQYILNTSLKKRLSSKCNSKDKKNSPLASTNQLRDYPDVSYFNRQKLLDEIRLALVDAIKDQLKLAKILRILDKIVELFNREISQKNREKNLFETMMQENLFTKKVPEKERQEIHIEPIKYQSQNDYSFDYENEKTRKNSMQTFKQRKGSNVSSEEITNINILIMSRHDPLPETSIYQSVEETLLNVSYSGIHSKHDESKISIDVEQSRDCELSQFSLMNSHINNNNWLKKSQIQPKEELRSSSTNWRRPIQQGSVLNRFEQFKKRVVN